MAKYTGVVTGRRILLSNADNVPVELVQNDKDTTIIDFELSKIDYVADLSQLNVTINYVNVDKDTGESVTDIYTVDKTTVEGDTLKFSWTVGSNASVYAGKCIFQIVLTLTDAEGVITQQWDSTKQSIDVHASLENVNVTQPKSFVDFVTQVKKTVSDGKKLVATAITDKGVATSPTDTFATMAANIGQIESGTKNTITIYSKSIISNANPSNTVIAEKILKTPYLLGNGVGYFNTHHEFTANTRIEFKFMHMHTNDKYKDLTGFGNSSDFWILVEFDNNRMDYYSGNGIPAQNSWYNSINTMYHGVFDAKNGSFKFNNYTEVLYPSKGIGMEIPIFAVHKTSGEFTNQMTNMLRLYAFQIYEDDVLVKDYVPAQDSSGITCLYDKVNDEYLYDATGTNTFEYGEEYRI